MKICKAIGWGCMAALLLTSGCATQHWGTMVSLAPVSPFKPRSGEELLTTLNARLPFQVEKKDFRAFTTDTEGVVGWVVLEDNRKARLLQRAVASAPDLQVRAVGEFDIESRDDFSICHPATGQNQM